MFDLFICFNSLFCPLTDAAIRHANWDPTKVREKLRRDIDAHTSSVQNAKLSELKVRYEVILFIFSILYDQFSFMDIP